MQQRDDLFTRTHSDTEAFAFNEEVTAVFGDMIRRSVPGYATVIAMTGVLAAEHVDEGARIYDLGCSLGTSLYAIAQQCPDGCTLVGIDNSEPMIEAAESNLSGLPQSIDLHCADLNQAPINKAQVVVLNYTFQFIAPHLREQLMQRIYTGLNPGGVLILSEKVEHPNSDKQAELERLYYAFKKRNGYSQLEISRKRAALENVLVSETRQAHVQRLETAGFEDIDVWFQCLNFESYMARKPLL